MPPNLIDYAMAATGNEFPVIDQKYPELVRQALAHFRALKSFTQLSLIDCPELKTWLIRGVNGVSQQVRLIGCSDAQPILCTGRIISKRVGICFGSFC